MRKSIFESILILGTGTLALNIAKQLKEVCTDSCTKLLCASYLESPFSLFSTWCKTSKIPYTSFHDKTALEDYINSFKDSTLIISAHNYYLFPAPILRKPFLKIINYHNSLLPLHRGLNAQMWSIFEQDSASGITWHCVSSGIDCGEIILQKSISLDSTYTYLKLTQEQLQLGFNAFVEICDSLMQWNLSLKMQEKSSDSVLHKARYLPNNGILDLHWNFEKKSAFLRSMDCGKSHLLPKPKIILEGQKYTILDYTPNPKNALGFDFTLGECNE